MVTPTGAISGRGAIHCAQIEMKVGRDESRSYGRISDPEGD